MDVIKVKTNKPKNETRNLFKAVVQVATAPIEIVKDAVTLGVVVMDKKKPYTVKRIDDIVDTLNDL